MKKLVSFAASMLLMTTAFYSQANTFVKGKDYIVINEAASEQQSVTEFFSFYCGHCYNFEPFVKSLKKKLPENVKFTKSHVDFLGGATKEIQQALTTAYVAAEQLKVEDKIAAAIFDYIHKQRATFASTKDIRNIFIANGVKGEDYDKAINSFTVKTKTNLLFREQDKLNKQGVLSGVPAFVVNGKYKVTPENFTIKPKSWDELFQHYEKVVLFLTKQKG
ncbi:thiol:disulfide interchange protein DsbA/DsbL [Algicola sagamiensis]|uniref:thiol:disulfide interchange protein DsbA/DsbL n=1 Tax=Algicola sagamiensis TaxID=163869 RepID=UPI00037B0775|nr:thiol:disulfide interchange protein DsbA/DsbL [Algicola sagamiensis]